MRHPGFRALRLVAAGLAALSVAVLGSGVAAPTSPVIPADLPNGQGPRNSNVDVELILAVDVSYSMDPDEQALQREGYVFALTSPEFLSALRNGMHGKIAVTYFEWA
ncbi:MAG TPA: DUF1194 domain-containing protein, partial [Xanthobacteraceae bacterium]|jgi:hypothetical protein|nr:DUF1194 domain-containing protein [Xanthobacteraceae bacterium]